MSIFKFAIFSTVFLFFSACPMEQEYFGNKRKVEEEPVGEVKIQKTETVQACLKSNDNQIIKISDELFVIMQNKLKLPDNHKEIFVDVPYESLSVIAEFLEVIKYRLDDYIKNPNEETKYYLLMGALENMRDYKTTLYLKNLAVRIRNCRGLYFALDMLKLLRSKTND